MMAAQGFGVLWNHLCLSLVFLVVAAAGSKPGMQAVFFAYKVTYCNENVGENAVFSVYFGAASIRVAAVAFC